MEGQSPVRVGDVAVPKDAFSLQYNIVRVNGKRAVYVPIFKQGGDSNTIAIVEGVKTTLKKLYDVPSTLQAKVVFDQSRFVKTAIETLVHEGGIGLFLTCLMILIFLGSMRATLAVFFSIPLSVLATFFVLHLTGSSINSMVLGGLALALSRLIDNSVVVLENIFRHLEGGESPTVAAEKGGKEVALPVLAGTLTTVVVFFPVTLLYGVSRFLFTALALAVVISLFASYFVALTVVPLFCARFIKSAHGEVSHETCRRWNCETKEAEFRQELQYMVRRGFQYAACPIRGHGKKGAGVATSNPGSLWSGLSSELVTVPHVGAIVLSAHRSCAVRHQLQGSIGNEAESNRRRDSAS